MKFQLNSISTMAEGVLARAKASRADTATVIALSGDLGAGKTTLTQEIAKHLGIKENLISPTFVIMKSYKTTDRLFTNLIHIDAYRLNKSEELHRLGWEEILRDNNNLVIIEWPEKVPECIPGNAHQVCLSHVDEQTRLISF